MEDFETTNDLRRRISMHRRMRAITTDAQARAAINRTIAEAEERLRQLNEVLRSSVRVVLNED